MRDEVKTAAPECVGEREKELSSKLGRCSPENAYHISLDLFCRCFQGHFLGVAFCEYTWCASHFGFDSYSLWTINESYPVSCHRVTMIKLMCDSTRSWFCLRPSVFKHRRLWALALRLYQCDNADIWRWTCTFSYSSCFISHRSCSLWSNVPSWLFVYTWTCREFSSKLYRNETDVTRQTMFTISYCF